MNQRGRTSATALEVIPSISAVQRPSPPAELNDEQASEWRKVVDSLPAEWFPRETHALLAQFCRHTVAARRVAQLIAKLEESEEFSVKDYDLLLKMQDRESKALSSMATRMRVSQQSTLDREKRKPPQLMRPPWDE